jgi:hypothetical protein
MHKTVAEFLFSCIVIKDFEFFSLAKRERERGRERVSGKFSRSKVVHVVIMVAGHGDIVKWLVCAIEERAHILFSSLPEQQQHKKGNMMMMCSVLSLQHQFSMNRRIIFSRLSQSSGSVRAYLSGCERCKNTN